MNFLKPVFLIVCASFIAIAFVQKKPGHEPSQTSDMLIRIAEIEVNPTYIEEYISILKEEAEASIRLEPGVIAIYPMYQKENPNEIRILEIYADQAAYETHLQTPHFLKYKTTTLKMVKSLKLTEMEAIDVKTMSQIFKKFGL